MKRISLREFQLHASKYIKELPIVLTQYNKDVAKLESVNSSAKGHMTPTYPEPAPPKDIFEPQPKPTTEKRSKEIKKIKFTAFNPVPKPKRKK